MTRALVLSVLATGLATTLAPTSARADDSFEAQAAGAVRVARLDSLVWALTASCDTGDDIQQRQCRQVRDARASELSGATLLVDADPGAFTVGAWNPQKRSVPFSLSTCIRCGGVELDGKTWYLAGTGTPPRFDKGVLKPGTLHDNARTFPSEAAAQKWIQGVRQARVELLVKIPTRPTWVVDGKSGLGLDILGFRVVTPCDGAIVCARPTSGPLVPDKKQCGQVASGTSTPPPPGELEPVVPALTASMVREALAPVLAKARGCGDKYGVRGTGKLRLAIGGDGSILSSQMQGELANTPAAACILEGLAGVTFPRSQKPRTTIGFPIQLR